MSHGSHGSHSSHSSHSSHASHGNHINKYNLVDYNAPWDDGSHTEVWNADRDPGAPGTSYTISHQAPFTWANWPSGDEIDEDYVADTEAKIKELRDKVAVLANWKTGATVNTYPNHGGHAANFPPEALNTTVNEGKMADTTFDEGDLIDDNQYDGLVGVLDQISVAITGSASGLPAKNVGDTLLEADIEAIKTKIDELAAYDAKALHANHYNTHSNT